MQEVTISHNRVVRLNITGRHLNFFHFLIFLNINLQEAFQRILRLITYVQQIYPDNIFLVQFFERADCFGYFYFIVVFIEYSQF